MLRSAVSEGKSILRKLTMHPILTQHHLYQSPILIHEVDLPRRH